MLKESHCIVTPDYPGPVKNGGIGTHCYHFAHFLKSLGHEVSVLYTGPFEVETAAYWQRYFHESDGIEFINLTIPECGHGWNLGFEFNLRSRAVSELIEARSYDAIHFQEWRGNGFIPMQRRRTLGVLKNAALTITLHSSSEWIAEGGLIFRRGSFEHLVEEYCERYAVQHADIVLSPSRHMLDWVQQHGWQLPASQQQIPYLASDLTPANIEPATPDEIVFFGRLETRKGLEIFAEALSRLASEKSQNTVRKITFLGKHGIVMKDRHSRDFLAELSRELGSVFEITINSDLDHLACRDFLQKRPRALIVIPSLLDNFPFTVLECLQQGVRFIASNVGGIPEMLADQGCLFEPTVAALTQKLKEKCSQPSGATASAYSLEKTRAAWQRLLHETLPQIRRRNQDRETGFIAAASKAVEAKRVTICVPHFNYIQFLGDLLESFEQQSSRAFTVIVVDDGSTAPGAAEALERFSDKYQHLGWKFFIKDNGGIGHTRNSAAAHADTEYLIFMDADNVAHPKMVETFLNALDESHCDCLTSYFLAFPEGSHPNSASPCYGYMPVGSCLEAGLLGNVFGDANFIIRKSAFDAVGGFTEDRGSSYEDWELLARLALAGYNLDVIPEPLFYYRHTENGFSRATSLYSNHRRAIRPYMEILPDWLRRASRALIGSEAPTAPEGQGSIIALRSQIRKLEKQQAKLMARLEAEKARHQGARREIERQRSKPRGLRRLGVKVRKLFGKPVRQTSPGPDATDPQLVKKPA